MKLLGTLTDFFTGGLFNEIKSTVMTYFPPDMTPQAKAELELKLQKMLNEKEIKANQILFEASSQLDQRIRDQEGTSKDLKSIPFVGTIIIFMRGAQRPLWGYATIYMDFKWFFETNVFTEQQQTAMIVINMLVLGFLFGERTIKNLEPLIIKVFGK